MKTVARVAAVVVLALALCQSAMAAPTQGATMATANSSNLGLFEHFLQIFGAIWSDHGAIWSDHGAIWSDHGAIWSGDRSPVVSANSQRSTGVTTAGAIWSNKP